MKVSELSDEQLDAWVAKAEGAPGPGWYQEGSGVWARRGDHVIFRPSLFWELGGPIIEREEISIAATMDDREGWKASPPGAGRAMRGATPLIAAMRAYVASKFAEEISDA